VCGVWTVHFCACIMYAQVMQFEEHSKRVWSVDYSRIDPTRLVSGSDDGTIKMWTLNQEGSVASIDCKVCAFVSTE